MPTPSPGRRSGPRLHTPWWVERGFRTFTRGDTVALVRYSRKGFPYAATELLLGAPSYSAWLEVVEQGVYSMLEKNASRRVAGSNGQLPKDPRCIKEYPLLWDHLSQTTWPDGTARPTSSLLVFQQDGVLKGLLRDAAEGICLWVAGTSFFGVLGAIEAGLGDPNAEWRIDRRQEGQKATKVKRAV